jgi:adenine deaminase
MFDKAEDIALIACIQRHEPSGRRGLGLVRGFSFRRHGALGSSVGHDAHNLIITGTNGADMLACARALASTGGGFAAIADGAVRSRMPLPVAGLMTTAPAEEVIRAHAEVNDAAAWLGCGLHSPFGTLSFLALSVIPSLRITDLGLLDVDAFKLLDPAR